MPDLSPFAALVLLLLAFLAVVALTVLVLLAFEQRARMRALNNRLEVRLVEDRACVLATFTHGRTKQEIDTLP